ncbi:uncharacterized protein LOC124937318 [Impatiens glandulifera]|uniref:uncharacterized protein LOC124937318 n=1 Tax=Impatiens glandulifera TaxID=253017 RepID=UPI001FB10446|nr:uncharacterized protein LOC124937318 [Impatiens glandulifera]
MENFRSKSCKDGGGGGGGGMMQMESHYGGGGGSRGMHDLMRSYSTSHASSSSSSVPPSKLGKELKIKKIKNPNYEKNSNSSTSTVAGSKNWGLNDPELQRMKRVASYKVYALEGKMKGSFRKSFRWIKHTCNHVVYGWW